MCCLHNKPNTKLGCCVSSEECVTCCQAFAIMTNMGRSTWSPLSLPAHPALLCKKVWLNPNSSPTTRLSQPLALAEAEPRAWLALVEFATSIRTLSSVRVMACLMMDGHGEARTSAGTPLASQRLHIGTPNATSTATAVPLELSMAASGAPVSARITLVKTSSKQESHIDP